MGMYSRVNKKSPQPDRSEHAVSPAPSLNPLQVMADNSSQVQKSQAYQRMADSSSTPVQRVLEPKDDEVAQSTLRQQVTKIVENDLAEVAPELIPAVIEMGISMINEAIGSEISTLAEWNREVDTNLRLFAPRVTVCAGMMRDINGTIDAFVTKFFPEEADELPELRKRYYWVRDQLMDDVGEGISDPAEFVTRLRILFEAHFAPTKQELLMHKPRIDAIDHEDTRKLLRRKVATSGVSIDMRQEIGKCWLMAHQRWTVEQVAEVRIVDERLLEGNCHAFAFEGSLTNKIFPGDHQDIWHLWRKGKRKPVVVCWKFGEVAHTALLSDGGCLQRLPKGPTFWCPVSILQQKYEKLVQLPAQAEVFEREMLFLETPAAQSFNKEANELGNALEWAEKQPKLKFKHTGTDLQKWIDHVRNRQPKPNRARNLRKHRVTHAKLISMYNASLK